MKESHDQQQEGNQLVHSLPHHITYKQNWDAAH